MTFREDWRKYEEDNKLKQKTTIEQSQEFHKFYSEWITNFIDEGRTERNQEEKEFNMLFTNVMNLIVSKHPETYPMSSKS